MGQRSFFDVENRPQSVSKMGNPLEGLAAAIAWENSRPLLAQVHEKERKSSTGRRPLDVVLKFKALIPQTLDNLGDEQVEYQIGDRLSFARFLGLGIEDSVPDTTSRSSIKTASPADGLLLRILLRGTLPWEGDPSAGLLQSAKSSFAESEVYLIRLFY